MNKHPHKITAERAIELAQAFSFSPADAYEKLISSRIYFRHRLSHIFWNAFGQTDLPQLYEKFPDHSFIFQKMLSLRYLHDLHLIYAEKKSEKEKVLLDLNPAPGQLIRALFLQPELRTGNRWPSALTAYSTELLIAVKTILKELQPKLTPGNQSGYSLSLFELCDSLLQLHMDMNVLEEFADTIISSDFLIGKNENGPGYLMIPPGDEGSVLQHIHQQLKTSILRNYRREHAHDDISNEKHFVKHDPFYKTHLGLATVFHTSGVQVTQQPEGTTAIPINDSIFSGFDSSDPREQQESKRKFISLVMQTNFHHKFRHALAEIYYPNDEIKVHGTMIECDSKTTFSLYEIICGMSCLIAKADGFRYASEIGAFKSIPFFKQNVLPRVQQLYPKLTPAELNDSLDNYLIHHLAHAQTRQASEAFRFIEEKKILGWFRCAEELKEKSDNELRAMLKLFAGLRSSLPFNPLYKCDEGYYFSFRACTYFNLNQLLYDHLLSDRIFNNRRKPPARQPGIRRKQNQRSSDFSSALARLFRSLTPYVEADLEFGPADTGYDLNGLQGDCDMVAYFKESNVLLMIQAKLSNVTPRKLHRRKDWVDHHIHDVGRKQILKDRRLVHSKDGLRFIADKLGCAHGIVHPRLFQLIVTDNFFADHKQIPCEGQPVMCVSFFELRHLVRGEKIHAQQKDLTPIAGDDAIIQLMKALEENVFWEFIDAEAKHYQYARRLNMINEENGVEMKIQLTTDSK